VAKSCAGGGGICIAGAQKEYKMRCSRATTILDQQLRESLRRRLRRKEKSLQIIRPSVFIKGHQRELVETKHVHNMQVCGGARLGLWKKAQTP
jgi:hypothetical protein